MKKQQATFGALKGLEGVCRKEIRCVPINSPSSIYGVNMPEIAYIAGGDNGSLHIYKDDDGFLRGEAQRYCVTFDKKIFRSLSDVKEWFKKTYHKIQ